MLSNKRNVEDARNWITSHEIESRQYFNGQLNYAHLLAHTCCHEFAHLIQVINGWWKRGSIHNADFYRILDQIHQSGKAQEVLAFVNEQALKQNIPLDFFESSHSNLPREDFNVGDAVWLSINGQKISAHVKRINKRTLSVYPVDPKPNVNYYRVPSSLLTKKA